MFTIQMLEEGRHGPRKRAWQPKLLAFAAAYALCGAVALAGPSGIALAQDCPAARELHVPHADPGRPINIDLIKKQLRDYRARDYDGDIVAVDADVRAYLKKRAGAVARPALVLDIDETSLSNWQYLQANDFGAIREGTCERLPKGPCGFVDWITNHVAPAIGPTHDLFDAALAQGVAVFFITGRHEYARNATASNLDQAGYKGRSGLALRLDADTNRPVAEFKTEERKKIEAAGYTIIANVGDQQSDLDGGHAECAFKLPNPFYFIP